MPLEEPMAHIKSSQYDSKVPSSFMDSFRLCKTPVQPQPWRPSVRCMWHRRWGKGKTAAAGTPPLSSAEDTRGRGLPVACCKDYSRKEQLEKRCTASLSLTSVAKHFKGSISSSSGVGGEVSTLTQGRKPQTWRRGCGEASDKARASQLAQVCSHPPAAPRPPPASEHPCFHHGPNVSQRATKERWAATES